VRETSQPNEAQPLVWLLSSFDGVVGWLVLGWTVVMGLWLHRHYRRRAQLVGVRINAAS
jgi:hypothetical protein